MDQLNQLKEVKDVRGKGLMVGVDLEDDVKAIRSRLLFEEQVFTGSSSNPKTLRLLPPLTFTTSDADQFIHSFKKILS